MAFQFLGQTLRNLPRNAILLEISGAAETKRVGCTRFGGMPDVPAGFQWPFFETAIYGDDTIRPQPLSFLAQFDCAALASLDAEGLLPHSGLLSFFYEMNSQTWGYDPKDAGSAQVFWFPDVSALAPVEFPAALAEDFRFPALHIQTRHGTCWPDFQDFSMLYPELAHPACWEQVWGGWNGFCEEFDRISQLLKGKMPVGHKLLGWPDIIQGNMTQECELVRRGYYLGSTWEGVPEEERKEIGAASLEDWRLLLQLDNFGDGDGNVFLDFGDCGSIYFYIRKADLAARRFDRVWLILQCY